MAAMLGGADSWVLASLLRKRTLREFDNIAEIDEIWVLDKEPRRKTMVESAE